MAEPRIFFEEVNERQGVFHRRAFLFGAFSGLGVLEYAVYVLAILSTVTVLQRIFHVRKALLAPTAA